MTALMEERHLWMLGALTLLGALYLVHRWRARARRLPYFPGPTPLPLVGNISILKSLKVDPEDELMRLRKQWGDVCMLWFGTDPVLIISGARAANDLMTERGAIYASRPPQNNFRKSLWPFRLLSTTYGDTFRFLRRLYNNYLSVTHAQGFRKYEDYESRAMMIDLLDHPDQFLRSIDKYTMSVIFGATHGVRVDSLDHPIMVELYDIWEKELPYFEPGTLPIDFLPALQKLPNFMQPWHRKLAPLAAREAEIEKAFFMTMREARRQGSAPDCFSNLLLETQEKENVPDEMAVQILAMLVGAGADTSASVLQSYFKLIALNPVAQRKAQEELDRVVGPDRLPDWGDEPNLPYVRCLIKEIHRFGLIASLGIPHCTTQDDVYRGHLIPKGTIVFPNLTALSQDPERYANPAAFEPERFLGDDASSAASAKQRDFMQRDHFHFGFGRRMCPGIYVADASLFIVISRLLWGFSMLPRPGRPLDMRDKKLMLIYKHNPFQMDIVSRSPRHTEIMRGSLQNVETGALSCDDVLMNVGFKA